MSAFKRLFCLILLTLALPVLAQDDDEDETEEAGIEESDQASEKQPGGRIVHRSGESAAKNSAWIQLEMKLRKYPGFADYRRLSVVPPTGWTPGPVAPTAPAARLSVFESDFGFRVAAWGYAQQGQFVDLVGKLPFRFLGSTRANDVQGSEIAGYEFGIEGAPSLGVVLRSALAERRSSKFQLLDRHREWISSVRYQAYETIGPRFSIGVKTGPEAVVVLPQSDANFVRYGNSGALTADVFVDVRSGGFIFARVGAAAEMRRIFRYDTGTVNQGGAGLLALSPYLEFPVLDVLWIGLRLDLPIFRPAGRELAFGNLSHPGLFGNSASVSIQAMNF